MKRVILSIALLAFSVTSFAAMQPINPSKQTQKLQALGKAWKSYHSLQGNLDKNDIEMVYGGADVNPTAMSRDPIHA